MSLSRSDPFGTCRSQFYGAPAPIPFSQPTQTVPPLVLPLTESPAVGSCGDRLGQGDMTEEGANTPTRLPAGLRYAPGTASRAAVTAGQ